ncbi:hypothetical protein PIIN_06496 [Serendipita indica DSM 11827]|uniref:Uncharacterized protein n=1 Tax=Serendipita indica (strain DSM 11827) TaxID=1109443 RepID=G4TML4_SERID|nr:hypothetical protein PIIN_06496 [Serendipita indica DSM 11827]
MASSSNRIDRAKTDTNNDFFLTCSAFHRPNNSLLVALERQVTPFLIRTFVRASPGLRTSHFSGASLPTESEYQIYTWQVCSLCLLLSTNHFSSKRMDATLSELLLTLRAQGAPPTLSSTGTTLDTSTSRNEVYSSTAKYVFRSIYPDPSPAGNRDRANGGTFQSKELGVVYAKDLSDAASLDDGWEPNSSDTNRRDMNGPREEKKAKDGEDAMDTTELPTERPPKDSSPPPEQETNRSGDGGTGNTSTSRETRTLAELRFRPGDYISVTVVFPKGESGPPPSAGGGGANSGFGASGLNIRGSAGGGIGSRGDAGPPRQIPWVTGTSAAEPSRPGGAFSSTGGGWRGRGGGGPPGRADRDRDVPPPRDDRTRDYGGRGRGRGAGTRGHPRSRSRSITRGRQRSRSRSMDRSMASSRSRSRRSISHSRSRSPPRRRRGD